jgi:hypothetical protein
MEEASTRQEPAVSVPPGPPVTGEVLPPEWQVIADNSEEKTNLVRFSDPETGEAVTGEEAKAYEHAKGMTNDELGDFTAPHLKDTQACPYGFDTLACGNLDSCPFLGTQLAVSAHWEQTPNNSNSAISASSHLGYIQRAKNICLTLSKTAPVSPLD